MFTSVPEIGIESVSYKRGPRVRGWRPTPGDPPTGKMKMKMKTKPRPNDEPILLDITDIKPHPKNPRLALREDVIDAIAASLRQSKTYPKHHAITVRRRLDGLYEILQGHHRVKACLKAMVLKIWAFIVEASDEEAHQMLAFGNAQDALGSLEYGLHALDTVQKAKGQAGLGIRAYAARAGLKEQNLGRYIEGARVYRAVEPALRAANINIGGCRDKADHFQAIGKAVQETWADLAIKCVRDKWSVAKTRATVTPPPARVDPLCEDAPQHGDDALARLAQTDPTFAGFLRELLGASTVLGSLSASKKIDAALLKKWPLLSAYPTYGDLRDAARLIVGKRGLKGENGADRPEEPDDSETVVEPAISLAMAFKGSPESIPWTELLVEYWLLHAEVGRRLEKVVDYDLVNAILHPDNLKAPSESVTEAAKAAASLLEAALDHESPDFDELGDKNESIQTRYFWAAANDGSATAGADEESDGVAEMPCRKGTVKAKPKRGQSKGDSGKPPGSGTAA